MPKIKDLKSINKGNRCFVFGNGQSINDYDLNKILDEYIFVVNDFHIHKLWPKFTKPFYTELSGVSFLNGGYSQWKYNGIKKNENALYFFQKKFKPLYDNLYPKERMYYLTLDRKNTLFNGYFNKDITKGSSFASSVVIEGSLAIAQYMGFKDIYLLGCENTQYIDNNNEIKDNVYFFDWKSTPKQFWPRIRDKDDNAPISKSWNVISSVFKEQGINIYNLSNRSKLDMFEHKEFDDII